MSEFSLEKIQVPAELTLTNGEAVPGFFFVAGFAAGHDGPERLGELLNGRDGFFPFQRADGTTTLYNRPHIVIVRLGENVQEAELEPGYAVAKKRRVTMRLSTGETLAGVMPIYRPRGSDRLSDYSPFGQPFRYLLMADRTLLVNSSHVVELTELIDG
jgi:hypothetical protein